MAKVKPRVKVPKTAEVDEVIEIKTLISHPMQCVTSKLETKFKTLGRSISLYFSISLFVMTVVGVILSPNAFELLIDGLITTQGISLSQLHLEAWE